MRLISQTGKIDVSYEKSSLHIVGTKSSVNHVICANFNGIDISVQMGTYSTEEKALKVMEMVRNSFCNGHIGVFQFPKDADVEV